MKKLKLVVPAIVTIMIISLCLYLPRFVSSAYDYRLSTQIKEMDNSNVSLNFSKETDFFERAQLFNYSVYNGFTTELASDSSFNMTSIEVEENVKRVLSLLGIDALAEKSPKVIPYLCVYSDSMTQKVKSSLYDNVSGTTVYENVEDKSDNNVDSNIFWQCVWNGNDEEQMVFIDDKTGLILGFSIDYSSFSEKNFTYDDKLVSIYEYFKSNCTADKIFVNYYNEEGYCQLTVNKDEKEYSFPVFYDGERISFNLM